MGNIIYEILTGRMPWLTLEQGWWKIMAQKVRNGERPEIEGRYANSTDPNIEAIMHVIQRCWIHKPKERASAREIEQYLSKFLPPEQSAGAAAAST